MSNYPDVDEMEFDADYADYMAECAMDNMLDNQAEKFDGIIQDLKDLFSNLPDFDDRDELCNMLEGFIHGFKQRKGVK